MECECCDGHVAVDISINVWDLESVQKEDGLCEGCLELFVCQYI
jgi:hypothetical protein